MRKRANRSTGQVWLTQRNVQKAHKQEQTLEALRLEISELRKELMDTRRQAAASRLQAQTLLNDRHAAEIEKAARKTSIAEAAADPNLTSAGIHL